MMPKKKVAGKTARRVARRVAGDRETVEISLKELERQLDVARDEGRREVRVEALAFLHVRYLDPELEMDSPRGQALLELAKGLSEVMVVENPTPDSRDDGEDRETTRARDQEI
jgi:hypothetical protein